MSADDNRKTVIELQNVRRDFVMGDETVHALRGERNMKRERIQTEETFLLHAPLS